MPFLIDQLKEYIYYFRRYKEEDESIEIYYKEQAKKEFLDAQLLLLKELDKKHPIIQKQSKDFLWLDIRQLEKYGANQSKLAFAKRVPHYN